MPSTEDGNSQALKLTSEASYQRLPVIEIPSLASSPLLQPIDDEQLGKATNDTPASSPPTKVKSKLNATNPADGVFSNLSAKTTTLQQQTLAPLYTNTTDYSHVPCESPTNQCLPPSYEMALADPSPPLYLENTFYCNTSLSSDTSANPNDPAIISIDSEVIIEGLVIGSTFAFFITLLASVSFQLVGFVFTYILSWSHAGRNGSSAGFGLTLMQVALFLRTRVANLPNDSIIYGDDNLQNDGSKNKNSYPEQLLTGAEVNEFPLSSRDALNSLLAQELFSYVLLVIGWAILVRSCAKFIRIKRLESIILANPGAYIA